MKDISLNRSLLSVATILALGCMCFNTPALSQVDEADPATEIESESKIGPIPTVDLGDEALDADYARFLALIEEKEYARAFSVIKRIKGKVRKPAENIAEAFERCMKEAEGGVVLEKARKYADKDKMKQALAVIEKEDPSGDAFDGSFTGEELSQLREEAFDAVFLVLADYEKKGETQTRQADDDEEGDNEGEGQGRGRGEPGGGRGPGNSKVIGGSPEDGDVRTGKYAMHWQTGDEMSFLDLGKIDEEIDLTEFRYLRISLRCEDPRAKPQVRILFDVDGGQARLGRGYGRRGAARAFQREGFQTAVEAQFRWRDFRIDLKKFSGKGEVEWDMVEVLRLIHTSRQDTLIMIDDVRLERP
ncbi:MAG: hypothetical protein COB10_07825 [Planctomycetota bacterium]|nr:MAG: hypothetical protein COB10_07825 [Planctomycetota bacterium]